LPVSADNSYPYSFKIKEIEESGKLIQNNRNGTIYNYLIKPSWGGESEVITVWKGLKKEKTSGTSFGDVNIIASFIIDKYLYLIYEEDNKLFLSALDTLINTKAVSEIYIESEILGTYNIDWLTLNNEKFALLINNNLFKINHLDSLLEVKFLSTDILAMAKMKSKNETSTDNYENEELYFLKKIDNFTELRYLNQDNTVSLIERLHLATDILLQTSENYIFIISGNKYSDNSWIHICNKKEGILKKFNLQSHLHLIKVSGSDNNSYITYMVFDNLNYTVKKQLVSLKSNELIYQTQLPEGLIEAKQIYIINDTSYYLFRNGLVSISPDGMILSKNYYPFGEFISDSPDLFKTNNDLYISTYSITIIFHKIENTFWIFHRFLLAGGNYLFPAILIVLLIIIYRKLIVQRTMANALLDLPSAGVVFIIDMNGRLRRLNESGKKMLGITEDVPLRRIFKYYCDIDKTHQLQLLVDKIIAFRTGFTQRINIFESNTVKEWFISVYPLRTKLGKSKGYIITGIDITEELERRRINNLAQLAHDMQTNLSTIRLNAEQLDCNQNSDNITRRKKIMHQVTLLIQRVRDIVTVGRSDNPDWQFVDAGDLCVEVRNEFDDTMFPNIEFILEIKSFQVKCDKQKLIRAIRNAVENGIRAINGSDGQIKISNRIDSRFCYFSVKDNGMGMDDERRKMMMTPYFSTSNKEGGAGIGTLIMQSVIEQHGGELKVISEHGKGTEIIFCIPNPERSKDL
jgi:signal transduction histidine kinase